MIAERQARFRELLVRPNQMENRTVTTTSQPSRKDIADRGDEIYERVVLPNVGPQDQGKLVLIDVRTSDYEVDQDEIAASDRLLARRPEAEVWIRQVGTLRAPLRTSIRKSGGRAFSKGFTCPISASTSW